MALIIHIVCNFVCGCKHFVFVALDNRVEKSTKGLNRQTFESKRKNKTKVVGSAIVARAIQLEL